MKTIELKSVTLLNEITTLVNQGIIMPIKTKHKAIRVFKVQIPVGHAYFYIRKDYNSSISLDRPIAIGSYCPDYKRFSFLSSIIEENIPVLKELSYFSTFNKDKAKLSFDFLLKV